MPGLKEDDLRVAGAENISLYRSSEWAERAFCNRCGSNLWYHFIPAGTRSFLAGLFKLSDDYHVREQIFVEERPEWARLAAQSAEKTGEQVMVEAKAAGWNLD